MQYLQTRNTQKSRSSLKSTHFSWPFACIEALTSRLIVWTYVWHPLASSLITYVLHATPKFVLWSSWIDSRFFYLILPYIVSIENTAGLLNGHSSGLGRMARRTILLKDVLTIRTLCLICTRLHHSHALHIKNEWSARICLYLTAWTATSTKCARQVTRHVSILQICL